MLRPYDIERRGICVPSARRIGHCLGYRLRNSHVKRFADAFEALAVARFPFVGGGGHDSALATTGTSLQRRIASSATPYLHTWVGARTSRRYLRSSTRACDESHLYRSARRWASFPSRFTDKQGRTSAMGLLC